MNFMMWKLVAIDVQKGCEQQKELLGKLISIQLISDNVYLYSHELSKHIKLGEHVAMSAEGYLDDCTLVLKTKHNKYIFKSCKDV